MEGMRIVDLPAATLRTAKAGRSFWVNMVIRIMMLL